MKVELWLIRRMFVGRWTSKVTLRQIYVLMLNSNHNYRRTQMACSAWRWRLLSVQSQAAAEERCHFCLRYLQRSSNHCFKALPQRGFSWRFWFGFSRQISHDEEQLDEGRLNTFPGIEGSNLMNISTTKFFQLDLYNLNKITIILQKYLNPILIINLWLISNRAMFR